MVPGQWVVVRRPVPLGAVWGLSRGGAKKQPREATGSSHGESRGVPAAACRWRAGLSHLLSPRKLHSYEREGENVQFYTSLPRPVSSTKTISSHILTSENRAHANCESVAAKLTRVRVCVRLRRTCFQHASVFSCQESYPDTSRTGRWSKKRRGRLVCWMKFKTLRPFCRCRLVVYAHCWRTWKTSRIWRMTQIIFSLLPHDYPVGRDSGILLLSALFFPLCHCTIKHLLIHVRPPARIDTI